MPLVVTVFGDAFVGNIASCNNIHDSRKEFFDRTLQTRLSILCVWKNTQRAAGTLSLFIQTKWNESNKMVPIRRIHQSMKSNVKNRRWKNPIGTSHLVQNHRFELVLFTTRVVKRPLDIKVVLQTLYSNKLHSILRKGPSCWFRYEHVCNSLLLWLTCCSSLQQSTTWTWFEYLCVKSAIRA
jgi:hypothetical protein